MATYDDILGQGDVWQSVLDQLEAVPTDTLSADRPWLYTGCGASFHMATVAADLARSHGADAVAAPASEGWINPGHWLRKGGVVVGLSRTGTTTETVQCLRVGEELGLTTVGVSLDPSSPVVTDVQIGCGLTDLKESARVMTRSASALLLAAQWLWANAAQDEGLLSGLEALPDQIVTRMADVDAAARLLAAPTASNIVFLGSGTAYGIARQAALQLQETSGLPVSAYHPLEYRHGPMAGLDSNTIVVLISTSSASGFDEVLAKDVALLGGTFALCGDTRELEGFSGAGTIVPTSNGVTPLLSPTASLPFLQLFAYHQTVAVGETNESVRNLDRTVDPHVNPHTLPPGLVRVR